MCMSWTKLHTLVRVRISSHPVIHALRVLCTFLVSLHIIILYVFHRRKVFSWLCAHVVLFQLLAGLYLRVNQGRWLFFFFLIIGPPPKSPLFPYPPLFR